MPTIGNTILETPRLIEISTCFEDKRVVKWADFAADNAHDPETVHYVAFWLATQGIAHVGGGAAPLFCIRRAT